MTDEMNFYTLKGYERHEKRQLSSSMEDYLEMICRMLKDSSVVRIKELAENLHVKPSSASKMVSNLKDAGYLKFNKYEYVEATEKGLMAGEYLLRRHEVLHRFLCVLNSSENELEQVEKIEHFINEKTILNLEKITPILTGLLHEHEEDQNSGINPRLG